MLLDLRSLGTDDWCHNLGPRSLKEVKDDQVIPLKGRLRVRSSLPQLQYIYCLHSFINEFCLFKMDEAVRVSQLMHMHVSVMSKQPYARLQYRI